MIIRTAILFCALSMVPGLTAIAPAQETAAPATGRVEMWIDLYTGEPVEFDEMISDLVRTELIFLGEHHTVPRHHRRQLEIVESLKSRGASLVVGLEMLQKKYQPQLDRYGKGEIDFDQLAEMTEWVTVWGNYADYKEILEAARKAGLPILALNADLDIVRKVGRQGLEALTEEERSALPEQLTLDDRPYCDLLEMQMMVHAGVTEENLRNIFAAQVARDETMAETMANFLKSPAGRGRKAVVICGAGHCSYGYGTVSRLKNRLPEAKERVVILSESGDVELSPEMEKYMREIQISHQQLKDVIRQPLGNYLSVIQPKPAPKPEPEAPQDNP